MTFACNWGCRRVETWKVPRELVEGREFGVIPCCVEDQTWVSTVLVAGTLINPELMTGCRSAAYPTLMLRQPQQTNKRVSWPCNACLCCMLNSE